MTSMSSSVDDPEKHFLGNLLDEDSISSNINNKVASNEASSIDVSRSTTSAIPHASVISSVGPMNNDVSTFWPEPPPPYSPPKSPAVYWNDAGASTSLKPADSSLADFLLRSGLKINQRSFGETENLFDSDVSFLKRISQKEPFPTQIHHHHHNLHHHTHMHNVVENHHHYPVAMQPPPGFANVVPIAGVKPPSPLQAIGKERSEGLRKSPHSAPVVHRMPFSYRDVAARTDGPSVETTVVAQDGKNSLLIADSEGVLPRSDQKSASSECISMFEASSKNSKKVNEFQKIARKKGKEKKAVKDTISLPLMERKENMPIVNNYQLLDELPAAKDMSDITPIEDEEAVEELVNGVLRPKRPGNSDRRARVPAAPLVNKKRNPRKKADLPVWVTAILSLFSLLISKVSMVCVFLMTLIVDVCSDSVDVITFGFRCLVNTIVDRIKQSANYVLMSIYCRIAWLRQMRSSTLFVNDNIFPVTWGCSDIVLPTTAEEIMHRLVHLDHIDAYSILGLPANCSDDEIHQVMFILTSLLTEKPQLEGSAEALRLLSKAADFIATPVLRFDYQPTKEILGGNDHYVLNNLWELVCRLRKEAKVTLFCECGQRHAKVPMLDFKPSEARSCRRCSTYHSVKENDIWVESRLFGIVWQYLTYMDGTVYDISEWATCNLQQLPMLRPNCHSILYRFDVSRSCAREHSDELVLESKEVRLGALAAAARPLDREEDRSRRAANRRQKRR